MPIYEFLCSECNFRHEVIITIKEFLELEKHRTDKDDFIVSECPKCKNISVLVPSIFKIGSKSLNISNKSGYEDDDLTIGKLIDNNGIPYEYKDKIRKKEEQINESKAYVAALKERGKKYNFDPFSTEG